MKIAIPKFILREIFDRKVVFYNVTVFVFYVSLILLGLLAAGVIE